MLFVTIFLISMFKIITIVFNIIIHDCTGFLFNIYVLAFLYVLPYRKVFITS